jgi:glucose/arabinose dehydrogenase
MRLKHLLAMMAFGSMGSIADAAIVLDPFPAILPGVSAAVQRFITLPATATSGSKAYAQQLKPVRDGSNHLFVNDTRGVLYRTDTKGTAPTTWFDIRTQNVGFSNAIGASQNGLASFTFHPNFGRDPAKPGYATFYTLDTTRPGTTAGWSVPGAPRSHEDVVREWTVADPHAATANVLSQREVLRVAQPFADHGPGTIAFNPAAAAGSADYAKLYISFGDGGGVNDPLNNAQNLASPFGKILRIDPADPDGAGPLAYGIPNDNPLWATTGARGEIWAYGLRNPQNFSFDAATGTMLIADIGQSQIEEVNIGVAGANYGWPVREGSFARGTGKSDSNIYDIPTNDGRFLDPIAQYDHEEIYRDGHDVAAIGGAYLYAGSLLPQLTGHVVLDDLVTGRIFHFALADALAGASVRLSELMLSIDGAPTTMLALAGTKNNAAGRVDMRMGIDAQGELYFLTKRDGAIFRLVSAVPEPASWAMLILGFALTGTVLRRQAVSRPSETH